MTKREITKLFSVMMLAGPNAEMLKGGMQKLGPTISLWAMCLEDVDFWTGQQAVVRLCQECKFPPAIAEFKEKTEAVRQELRAEINKAWDCLKLAISISSPQKAFDKLSDGKTREAILALGGIKGLIMRSEKIFPDGRRIPYARYNYEGFCREYERILRGNASQFFPVKSGEANSEVKRIGGKTE